MAVKKLTAAQAAKKHLGKVMDYKRVFASEQGKRVLYDLIANHHMMSPTFGKGDAMELAYREGERNVVLRILKMMKTDPQDIINFIEGAHEHVQE